MQKCALALACPAFRCSGMRTYLFSAFLLAFQPAHAFAPHTHMSAVRQRFGKARFPHSALKGRVAMRAQESFVSPETNRRALLAALGVAIGSVGQPAYAIFDKSSVPRTTVKDANYEVDKELLATANLTQSLKYIKELREQFVAKAAEVRKNPTTEPMKPFFVQVFSIADIRQNVNVLTPAFDERTQETMLQQMAGVIEKNPRMQKDAKFKKGKDARGAKAAERLLGDFNGAIAELDGFLSFFPK